ncbi:MAG: patatin-like phospholipase family protein [Ulvibacter sp.]|nr:patatin-like phospholipase family protein [Ulvibacter sp.]|tara:strand:+ start:5152 stop:7401 length:2250 start_codon:yes stop_codon:yes gene_type:complete
MKHILCTFFIFLTTLGFSQIEDSLPPNKKDVSVGLVLSGGGARGLAHIGVLKAIEQAGVKIDYIAGTSTGAIVGALYASGYTASQLDLMFKQVDFSTLIQDQVPRRAKTFNEKDESIKYALTLPFDGFEISFPTGLSNGQNIYNLFSKLTSHVNHLTDFSKLPIPFLCVATNAENGEMVLLENGYLPRAVSASGALPTLFNPVVINDMILIDGGIVNNYPIKELKAKGVDVIIGVDVQDGIKKKKDLTSALDIVLQVNNYASVKQMQTKIKDTDVFIKPNIEEFSVVSFDDANRIVQAGFEAANQVTQKLERIAQQQTPRAALKPVPHSKEDLYIKQVVIEGNQQYTAAYILGKLKLKTPAIVSYSSFVEGVNNLSATGNFDDIDYRFVKDQFNHYTVSFKVIESKSKMVLRLGAHYDPLFDTGVLLNVTRKQFLTNNDIASLDVIVGDNLRYNFNYYIDKGFYWSLGFNSSYDFFDKNVSTDFVANDLNNTSGFPVNKIDFQYSDFTNQLYGETLFNRVFLLGAGVEHKFLRYISETIGTDVDNVPRTIFDATNYYSAFGYIKYDTYDNIFFPKKGVVFQADTHLYLFSQGSNSNFEPFTILKAKVGYAQTIFKKLTSVFTAETGFKIGSSSTTSLDFMLGGYGFKQVNNILPFYGYEALSLRGDTYLKSSITLDYEIIKNHHLSLFTNIANVDDALFQKDDWLKAIPYTGVGVGYGLNTFLGPLELKYAYSKEREVGELYVRLGFKF